ncbi:MAG TPA: GNAT family N-acetyltransferase [Prolixibacteraceae bacterium]|nr:GNAT family N-acetyltransferase [Prolixibacteraceae bacterium]
MIHLMPVSDSNDLDTDLKQIYLDSFPDNERREWNEMQQLLLHPLFNVCRIIQNGTLIGFISFWKWPHLLFIEHFALNELARGKGIGTRILKQIIDENPSTIIVEVEEPLTEQANRRIAFYQRLEFVLCQQEYYQPPYTHGNDKVKMSIMSYPQLLTYEEFTIVKKQIYKEVYKWDNYTDFP